MPTSFWRPGRCPGLLFLPLLAATTLVQAQSGPGRPPRPDPLDPQARVPAATHAPSLARYRRLGEDTRLDWKEANETVNRIGGWRAYARESAAPAPAAAAVDARGQATAPPAPASAPTPVAPHAHGGRR